jgi:hypothetical protein
MSKNESKESPFGFTKAVWGQDIYDCAAQRYADRLNMLHPRVTVASVVLVDGGAAVTYRREDKSHPHPEYTLCFSPSGAILQQESQLKLRDPSGIDAINMFKRKRCGCVNRNCPPEHGGSCDCPYEW